MPSTAIKTLQTIWDCRWSRPGYRVIDVQDLQIADGDKRAKT